MTGVQTCALPICITAIMDSSESNTRMIMPLISAHFFYWLYRRYSNVSVVSHLEVYFIKCVFFSMFIMLMTQLLMFAGIMPGLTDAFGVEIVQKIFTFIRVDGMHIGYTSYIALLLLFLLLYHNISVSSYLRVSGYITLFLVLVINQTRGAILPAIIILAIYFCRTLSVRNVVVLISFLGEIGRAHV